MRTYSASAASLTELAIVPWALADGAGGGISPRSWSVIEEAVTPAVRVAHHADRAVVHRGGAVADGARAGADVQLDVMGGGGAVQHHVAGAQLGEPDGS